MSKKTLKPVRDRQKGKAPAPYAHSTFEPLEIQKASIRNITNYLVSQISRMGMSVIVSKSRISKSHYLSVEAWNRRYTIRISDHALRHGKKHDFNIYTTTPYEKALHYLAFMGLFRKMATEMPENKGLNLAKFGKSGEIE